MDGTSVYQMVSGLGDAFGGAYASAVKERQEAEAPTLLSNLMTAYRGGGTSPDGPTAPAGPAGPPSPSADVGRSLPTFAQGTDIGRYASAIQSNESGGRYGIVGPTHPKYGRALGAYQVMESNLPSWSRESVGHEVSPDEFLRSPQIQDAIFQKKFGQSVAKYGNPEDAASVWFTGRPLAQGANARDVLGTTGMEYVRRFRSALGQLPAGTAPALPQTAMQMPGEVGGQAPTRIASVPAPGLPAPRRSSVAVAENEAETQALEREMGMVPGATQVASADAANVPAPGAQPAAFTIPEGASQDATQAAAPAQATAGLGGGRPQLTPDLRDALNAAWKNPNTRAVAAQVFSQLLTGKNNEWELKDVNGQSAWVNGRTREILNVGQPQRKTSVIGNSLVDQNTGEPIYSAPEKPISVAPGASLVSPDGKPLFTAPDRDRTIENERKGREETQSLRKEIQGLASFKNYEQALPIYNAMVEAAPRNSKAADLNLVYGLGKIMDPGSVVREGEMVMVKNTGSLPDWLVGSINGLNGGQVLTPETRTAIMTEAYGRMQAYEGALGQETARFRDIVARGGINAADVLPQFASVKAYEPPKKAETKAQGDVVKPDAGSARTAPMRVEGGKPPEGYTWESFTARAQKMLKERPDLRPQLEDMLAKAGIPPEKLGR